MKLFRANYTPTHPKVEATDTAKVGDLAGGLFPAVEECAAKLPKRLQGVTQRQRMYWYSRTAGRLLRSYLRGLGREDLAESSWFVATAISIDHLCRFADDVDEYKRLNPYKKLIAAKLFAGKLLGIDWKEYDKCGAVRSLVASIHREITPLLRDMKLVYTQSYIAGERCRGYDPHGLIMALGQEMQMQVRQQHLKERILLRQERVAGTDDDRTKPPALDLAIIHKKSKCPQVMANAVRYLQHQAKFRFNQRRWGDRGFVDISEFCHYDWNGYDIQREIQALKQQQQTKEVKATLKKLRYKLQKAEEALYARQLAIIEMFDGLDLSTEEPQYTPTWHHQGPGRIHTNNGFMWIPKPLRWLYSLPCNTVDNVLVEADLAGAQLRLACEFFAKEGYTGCRKTLDSILELASRGESVWSHIGPSGLPKKAKKVLVYALLFGCPRQYLTSLVNSELSNQCLKFRFTKESIAEILNCSLLKELVAAREAWLNQYSVSAIKADSGKRIKSRHTNALGLIFNLRKETLDYIEQREAQAEYLSKERGAEVKPTIQNHKVAGRLLAHYLQGAEAFLMQSFIASDACSEVINCFQFDGLTVEVHPDQIDELKQRWDAWLVEFNPSQAFEYETIWLQKSPRWYQMTVEHETHSPMAILVGGRDLENVMEDPRKIHWEKENLGRILDFAIGDDTCSPSWARYWEVSWTELNYWAFHTHPLG
jgi:hypothetical protein